MAQTVVIALSLGFTYSTPSPSCAANSQSYLNFVPFTVYELAWRMIEGADQSFRGWGRAVDAT
jgi:hypothetical protein